MDQLNGTAIANGGDVDPFPPRVMINGQGSWGPLFEDCLTRWVYER